ncbi:MAG: sigma-54-dependent transcriptional regulator, partial [Desulfosalsimonas sp.]
MNKLSILVVDDQEAMRESMAAWLEKSGYKTSKAENGAAALDFLEREHCDLVLLDIKMPGMDGHELLKQIRHGHPETIIVMITAYGSIESAIECMKAGASDYLRKPFNPRDLLLLIEKLTEKKEISDEYRLVRDRLAAYENKRFGDLLGCSRVMQSLFKQIEEVARADVPVLITGETGTGKELVARAIHSRSSRAPGPFVAINCGAIPEQLLESELFGHERGAFTDAVKVRVGRLEMADQGTLFLDEVGEVSSQMQVGLLRALEEKSFLRVGGSKEVESDFRLICATHRDMNDLLTAGRIRRDFFYRISVMPMQVPPLRE